MQRRLWQLLAVLLAFTLVAAACGDDDETSSSSSDAESSSSDAESSSSDAESSESDSGCERSGSTANPIKPDDTTSDVDASDVTAAFVYLTDPGDAGWTWAHTAVPSRLLRRLERTC